MPFWAALPAGTADGAAAATPCGVRGGCTAMLAPVGLVVGGLCAAVVLGFCNGDALLPMCLVILVDAQDVICVF